VAQESSKKDAQPAAGAARRAEQRERIAAGRARQRERHAALRARQREMRADLRGKPTLTQPPIWARPAPARGRRDRGLNRERIVQAAIALADAEGLDAVTMRAIAQRLRTGAMSLYWHVGSKDDLVDLMRDAVAGEFQRLAEPSGDWRSDLTAIATDAREAFLQHPWLTAVVGGRPALGPNFLRHAELSLAVVSHLSVDTATQLAIVFAVDDYVRGFATRELEERATGTERDEEWQEAVAPYMRDVLASGDYPHLAAVIGDGQYFRDEGARFAFGLQCLLDGIAARLPGDAG
jgi:AcrR family transcriptional regulator